MNWSPSRREYVKGTALIGLLGTAGCLSAADTSQPSTETQEPTTDAPTTAGKSETAPSSDPPLDAWLADANGYDEMPTQFSRGFQPTVAVGEPTDDGIAFAPAVIRVRPMTNVRWDWTGHGGQHNVVALDGTFDSGRTNAQSGTGYHYIFDETGVYPYYCEPHREDGMKGAVIVEEVPSTGYPEIDDWLRSTPNFTGEITDKTNAETATVAVGNDDARSEFVFEPPVLKIITGTTVKWDWEIDGPHTVSFKDHDIGTDEVVSETGVNFSHTFDSEGEYLYRCEPHETLGMRGAIIVE